MTNKHYFFKKLAFPLRIFLMLLLASTLLVAVLGNYLSAIFKDYISLQVRQMATNQGKIIASIDSVIDSVERRDTEKLKQIAQRMVLIGDFDYLVIGDANSIRLYHSEFTKIGKKMMYVDEQAMKHGDSYVAIGSSTYGDAVRVRVPILDHNGKIIGVVSLAYLLSKVEQWRSNYTTQIAYICVFILFVLMLLSWLFTRHIRRQMMGMEPKQIAQVVRQQETLLGSIFEGLIAVDLNGGITTINRNACKILSIQYPRQQWVGRHISDVVEPITFFTDKIETDRQDVVLTINNVSVIANRAAIRTQGDLLGVVVSFRSKNDINTLTAQLTQVKQYVENLRTVHHEHLNWMSTLSGLLQMKEYDLALAMIKGESQAQQQLVDYLREIFHDRFIGALLFGKVQRARELGLTLNIVPGSRLWQLPPNLDSTEFTAVIGNLLDNAFDASLKNPDGNKLVEIYLSDEGQDIILEVSDQGCGIPEELQESIFERGVTSKENQPGEHGIGLYLISSYIQRSGGVITLNENTPYGTLFSIFIPKAKKNDDATIEHSDR